MPALALLTEPVYPDSGQTGALRVNPVFDKTACQIACALISLAVYLIVCGGGPWLLLILAILAVVALFVFLRDIG
jgi:hypothetical protein